MQAALPKNEVARLDALSTYRIMDTLPEQAYDDITQLAAHICKTPIALVSLVDMSRQWFKSKVGLAVGETPRGDAFCAHALLQPEEILMVGDTFNDARFADNRLVVGAPYIRFYAGVPLVTKTGEALGTLCVIDTQPRELDVATKSALCSLARQVMAQLELRKMLFEVQRTEQELNRLNLELTAQTLTDPLTRLNNRRALARNLVAEWERAFRYSQPLSLLMLDVDEFKSYNDEFGHPAGDGVLQQLAEIIAREARQPDFVARYGGEEFVIVLPETDSEGALKIAERIRYKIERASWPHRPVTISIGQACYGSQADADTLLAQADQALYLAKQAGRNCVMAFI
ncbi:MAG: sensor domain-containing diguanylate cyclase [Gallionella sp.]|jgi:diguanylate cyclase (GGDEF)-like protein|nr:sensor domain-containing diguanylate cyclase [Gallionella sp.]